MASCPQIHAEGDDLLRTVIGTTLEADWTTKSKEKNYGLLCPELLH